MAPTQAETAAQAVQKGRTTHRAVKARTPGVFKTAATQALPKNPTYPRRAVTKPNGFDAYAVLRAPVTTEHSMAAIEECNTVTFFVTRTATKQIIRDAFEKAFGVRPIKINTLITPLCDKKAYIRLPADVKASEFATKHKLQ